MIRCLTAGESHGEALIGIVEDIPAGLPITADDINLRLGRRWQGFGRGGRSKIENDKANIYSGVRFSKTLGSPIAMHIPNLDFQNWTEIMAPFGAPPQPPKRPVFTPRPGHADLAGGTKHRFDDLRNVLERASARICHR